MSRDSKEQRSGFMAAFSSFSQIGITIIVCVAIGILLGKYLDNLLGTSPWLLLVFMLFGIAAAIKSILDIAKKQ